MSVAENYTKIDTSAEISVKGGRTFCAVKRLTDFILSALGLIVLFVPMVMIALAIRIESPGPIIFKQERLGLDRKPFILYKFRSMQVDAEKMALSGRKRMMNARRRLGVFCATADWTNFLSFGIL